MEGQASQIEEAPKTDVAVAAPAEETAKPVEATPVPDSSEVADATPESAEKAEKSEKTKKEKDNKAAKLGRRLSARFFGAISPSKEKPNPVEKLEENKEEAEESKTAETGKLYHWVVARQTQPLTASPSTAEPVSATFEQCNCRQIAKTKAQSASTSTEPATAQKVRP